MVSDWKDSVDLVFRDFIKSLIEETKKYRDVYENSDNPSKVQIWIALGILYRKLLSIEGKLSEIESIINNKELRDKLEEYLRKL
ncbi:MAG: hypothetical protein ACO2ON_03435 [Candidatus Nanopusillus sp.]